MIDSPIILAFILYGMSVIIPLIPAVILYKLFPDTKVGADGVLGNMNVKTTGAFAAYLVTTILFFFLSNGILNMIESKFNAEIDQRDKSWQVETSIKFMQIVNGDTIPYPKGRALFKKEELKINTFPVYINKSLDNLNFLVGTHKDKIQIIYPGYRNPEISLRECEKTLNQKDKRIEIEEIVLIKDDQDYRPSDSVTGGVGKEFPTFVLFGIDSHENSNPALSGSNSGPPLTVNSGNQ